MSASASALMLSSTYSLTVWPLLYARSSSSSAYGSSSSIVNFIGRDQNRRILRILFIQADRRHYHLGPRLIVSRRGAFECNALRPSDETKGLKLQWRLSELAQRCFRAGLSHEISLRGKPQPKLRGGCFTGRVMIAAISSNEVYGHAHP